MKTSQRYYILCTSGTRTYLSNGFANSDPKMYHNRRKMEQAARRFQHSYADKLHYRVVARLHKKYGQPLELPFL